MSPETPPLANRRPAPRKRAFLGCTVVYGEGAYSFPCVIRDIAPKGARIGFEAGHAMPSSFWLINGRDRTAHKARIAWSTARKRASRSKSSYPLHQLPPDAGYLKRFQRPALGVSPETGRSHRPGCAPARCRDAACPVRAPLPPKRR